MTFPLILPLFDYLEGKNWRSKNLLFNKIPFLIGAILIGYITLQIQTGTAVKTFEDIPMFLRFFYAGYAFILYLVNFLFPFNLHTLHPYPIKSAVPFYVYLMPFIGLAVTGAGLYFARAKKEIVFAILFFIFTISITLQIISFGAAIFSERYTYIPYLGLGLLLGYGIDFLRKRYKKPSLAWILLGALTIYYSILSVRQVEVWQNSVTLWTQVIEKAHRTVASAHKNRATALKELDRVPEAEADLEIALRNNPKDNEAMLSLANIYTNREEYEKSINIYDKVISNKPELTEAYISRSVALHNLNRTPEAIADLTKALELEPQSINALKNRGTIYYYQENYPEALKDYLQLIEIQPNAPDVLNGIVTCYQAQRDYSTALSYADRAISLDNTAGLFYFNRAITKLNLGDLTGARSDSDQAQKLGYPVDPAFLQRLK